MSNRIGHKEIVDMILGAADKICQNHELLSELDAATGDVQRQ